MFGVLASLGQLGASDDRRPGGVRSRTWTVPAPGQPKRSTILGAPTGTWSLRVARATRTLHDPGVGEAGGAGGAGGAGAESGGAGGAGGAGGRAWWRGRRPRTRGQLARGSRDTPSGLRSWPKPLRGALLPP